MRQEDDWIKLEDDETPTDEHELWEAGFLFLMAILAAVCIIGAANGWSLTP